MMTYVTAFIFYTLAMIGILLIGFIVYRKVFVVNRRFGRGIMRVVDSMPIGHKKNLLIVKIMDEKFLIASGAEHTTFLAKLTCEGDFDLEEEENTSAESSISMLFGDGIGADRRNRYEEAPKVRASELQRHYRDVYAKEEARRPMPQMAQNPQSDLTAQEAQRRQELVKKFMKNLNLDPGTNDWSRI